MLKCLVLLLTSLLSFTAVAQQKFVEGKDYVVINNPVRTIDSSKIEVTEVFWYGCSHCNTFRPLFAQWEKQQAEDVYTRHSPAIWNKRMVTHASIFYTAKALGKLKTMHKDIFDALHIRKKKLLKQSEIYGLFAKQGVDENTFTKAFASFGVRSSVQQAESRARSYGITGTPELVVNGKYRVSGGMAGSQRRMLQVASFLIDKERAAMAAGS
ncbi:MAG: thiol:disulfide interchange protein DsbA/DsbL [Cellvibrionaceae bacterium]|nr:thiol:disulfide interchange protein DsbA/DsbL [Cellvibrionaceae bacterium]